MKRLLLQPLFFSKIPTPLLDLSDRKYYYFS